MYLLENLKTLLDFFIVAFYLLIVNQKHFLINYCLNLALNIVLW